MNLLLMYFLVSWLPSLLRGTGPPIGIAIPGYYAAVVLDPDGNDIEAVCHGEARRNARSVVIEF